MAGAYGDVTKADVWPDHQQWVPFKGIYYANSKTRTGDVKDGLSQTLAFGETLGLTHRNGQHDWEVS